MDLVLSVILLVVFILLAVAGLYAAVIDCIRSYKWITEGSAAAEAVEAVGLYMAVGNFVLAAAVVILVIYLINRAVNGVRESRSSGLRTEIGDINERLCEVSREIQELEDRIERDRPVPNLVALLEQCGADASAIRSSPDVTDSRTLRGQLEEKQRERSRLLDEKDRLVRSLSRGGRK